jgi:hypothetical protein
LTRTISPLRLGVVLLAALLGLALAPATAAHASTTYNMYVTLYGWPDNSPPGNDIAYPVIHDGAGGTGTYSDPVTFATDKSELAAGTRVYYPYLKKYFVMEDDCAECDGDWNGSGYRHIDLWAGGSNATASQVLACEDKLTQDGQVPVIVNPPSSETVSGTPIFSTSTKKCYNP